MRDMRYVNDCCRLSKGTQSDGLISDTSTEELTSSSSTENLKESPILEKVIGETANDASLDSKNSIHLETSSSLHEMQTRCQLYIRWSVLLSFGILLWIALWITDVFNPNPFLKEGWLIDVATAKKVTLKAGTVKKPGPSTWWFFNLLSYAWNSITSVTTLDVLIFLCCVTILVYFEARTRNKWGGTTGILCYDQFYKSLLDTGAEPRDTNNSSFHCNILEKELTPKESEMKICGDDLSKFSHGDVRNYVTQDEVKVKSKLGEKSTQCLNQVETSSIENRICKSLRGSHNLNNTRKRSLQLNSAKNYCNFSSKRNNLSRDIVTGELIFNRPNIDFSRTSSMSENDTTKTVSVQPNVTCAIINKSTRFMSEKIETWFELPNSDQAEKVMHSFDTELEKFFKIRSNPSPLTFVETTQDLQRFNSSNTGCNYDEGSKTMIFDDRNGGIVSSSPAFRRFLMNLAKDRLCEPY